MLAVVPASDVSKKRFSQFMYVSPQYFQTVGMRILRGRDVIDRDVASAPPVALVNETFVRQYAIEGNPVGTTIRTVAEPGLPATAYTVVGVVSDAKDATLREPVPPTVFVPLAQDPLPPPWPGIVIQSSAPATAVATSVRRAVAEARPNMAIAFTVFDAQVRDGLLRERLLAWLSGALGALATLLALIGVYGVVAYFVVSRRHEIGIRLALGAGRLRVIRWVFGETFAVLTIGLAVGAALSVAVASAANDLLFGLSAHDPITVLAAVGALALVALLATAWPAIRASGLEPGAALRCD
jgi:hypothetical protein